ncbi:hypothetical protein HDU98_000171 [Podochytrium sp. JEL0797]|nr:hypothetical protein HDU98_000171 [Podochytrium sp. JEL0797]
MRTKLTALILATVAQAASNEFPMTATAGSSGPTQQAASLFYASLENLPSCGIACLLQLYPNVASVLDSLPTNELARNSTQENLLLGTICPDVTFDYAFGYCTRVQCVDQNDVKACGVLGELKGVLCALPIEVFT